MAIKWPKLKSPQHSHESQRLIIFTSYEMMLRCWAENPHSRPSFDEISQFIGKILSNQPEPEAGATGQDGYLYVRYVTKDIPEDYLINNLHHDYDNIITAQTVWEVYIDPAAQATKQ